MATRANGQPAFACYTPGGTAGDAPLAGLFVLTMQGHAIAAITWFAASSVAHFGLPPALPEPR